ncbi:hypothetical protein DPMN_018422 [Dreissena polymorpha]|uniref:Uncharacterized protein n=1 Tax=Dreissena polymorpha TaxID=45954 RepID=A0A9D4NH98_DREPO|nr:hypothetical protein DPMN_018422 [Dreissena polymorpha]
MMYVLILAFVLTCVSCGERNALGLSARTNEDSVPLDPYRRDFGLSAVLGFGVVVTVGSLAKYWGFWKRRSTDVSLN